MIWIRFPATFSMCLTKSLSVFSLFKVSVGSKSQNIFSNAGVHSSFVLNSKSSDKIMATEECGNGLPLSDVMAKLELFAPPSLAEPWDNVGLLVEPIKKRTIKRILLTNDLTEDVMKEALDVKTDMILSYHPPIFSPLKRITSAKWKERIIASCLENGIALYSPHTAWDAAKEGVNDWLAKAFEVTSSKPLIHSYKDAIPYCNVTFKVDSSHVDISCLSEALRNYDPDCYILPLDGNMKLVSVRCQQSSIVEVTNLCQISNAINITKSEQVPMIGVGQGRLCQLLTPLPISEAVSRVKRHIGISHLRLALARGINKDGLVRTVAICAGSGASVLRGIKADLYLTGEMLHHDILEATQSGVSVILTNHSDSERGFLNVFVELFQRMLGSSIHMIISKKDRDPLETV